MNTLLLSAGILAIFVGLIHSALGEFLIFKHLRKGRIIPTLTASPLTERHTRILWATWHIASLFGWAIAAILIVLATADEAPARFIVQCIAIFMFAAGALVLIATKAKHPGWIGLLGVAILCWCA